MILETHLKIIKKYGYIIITEKTGVSCNYSQPFLKRVINKMKKLLKITNNRRKEKLENNLEQFDDAELKEIMNNYDSIIEKGFVEYKEFKHKYEYENEENLLEFLRDFKENITAWIKDFSIPYSNNLAESLLRMSKTKMKISYQFKNLNYAEYFANINTYTETCYKFGKNKY